MFDTLIIFLKDFLEKGDFEKDQQMTKKSMQNYPVYKEILDIYQDFS